MDLFRIFLKRRVQVKPVFPAERVQDRPGKTVLIRTGLPSQHCDRTLINRKGRIRDHQLLGKLHLISKSETLRAGAEGIVEGKTPGLDLLDADPAVRTGKALAEIHRFPIDHIHHQKPLRQMQYILHRVCQTFLNARFYDQAVHDDLDIMFDILVQGDILRQLVHIPVDAHADVAAALRLFQQLRVGSLAPPHHRREELDLRPLRQGHDLVHHLVYSLLHDLPPAFRTVRDPDPGIKETEIVVDFCHSSYRGTGIVVR